jgi:hypothetical protein
MRLFGILLRSPLGLPASSRSAGLAANTVLEAGYSVAPKALEPIRCQRRVARRILDITMDQVGLQRSRVDTVLCQLIAAGM